MTKIKPKDFMAALKVANDNYQAAVRRYMRIERGGCAKEGFEAQQAKLKDMGKKVQELHDEIGWLVGGLFARPSSAWGRMARQTMMELLKKSRMGRKG